MENLNLLINTIQQKKPSERDDFKYLKETGLMREADLRFAAIGSKQFESFVVVEK